MRSNDPFRAKLLEKIETTLATLGDCGDDDGEQRDRHRRSVLHHVGEVLQIGVETDPALLARLEKFIEDGWTIAQVISRTDPPGELFAVDEGIWFDPSQHKASSRSLDSGAIKWTLQLGTGRETVFMNCHSCLSRNVTQRDVWNRR